MNKEKRCKVKFHFCTLQFGLDLAALVQVKCIQKIRSGSPKLVSRDTVIQVIGHLGNTSLAGTFYYTSRKYLISISTG